MTVQLRNWNRQDQPIQKAAVIQVDTVRAQNVLLPVIQVIKDG